MSPLVIAALVVGVVLVLVASVQRPVTQEQIDRMANRSPVSDAWPLLVAGAVLAAMWAISSGRL